MTASLPSRRFALQSIAGAILGAVAYSKRPHWPGFFGGYIRATPLEPLLSEEQDDQLPPTEFVTSADDDRLADLAPLRDVLQRPDEQHYFERELSRREFGDTYSVLADLPVFEPDYEKRDHPAVSRGIYVREGEFTYRIQLVPWCSDAWWIETRGTPEGWNRCHQR